MAVRTATHEAGHAVIGRVLKQVCGEATIVPDFETMTAGYHDVHDPWATYAIWDSIGRWRGSSLIVSIVRGRIMTFMAGAEAERVFYGASGEGDGDDRHQIDLMYDSFPDVILGDVVRYDARLRQRTRHLITRHRPKIEAVAAALIDRGALKADEIDAIIGQPSLTMAMWKDPA